VKTKKKICRFQKKDYVDIDVRIHTGTVISDIDCAADQITKALLSSESCSIPSRIITVKNHDKAWMNDELRSQMYERNKCLKIFKKRRTPENWEEYRYKRNLVNIAIKNSKDANNQRLGMQLENINISPKKWHKLTKDAIKKPHCSTFPPIRLNGKVFFQTRDKANAMNKVFCEIPF
jgi:hypothetical protein